MAEVLRVDHEAGYACRLTRIDEGFLITAHNPDVRIWILSEWLHRTREAADACFETVKGLHAALRVIKAGLPADALLQKAQALSNSHNQLCDRLGDYPRVGPEVEALRDELGACPGNAVLRGI